MKIGKIRYGKDNLVPLIVQDKGTKQVLSVFYANEKAVEKMRKTGYVWRYSRKNRRVMKKGEESGNAQRICKVLADCDKDALVAIVEQEGKCACHKGTWSCFEKNKALEWGFLEELIGVIESRRNAPLKGSYTSKLFASKREIGNKLREEAAELEEAILEKTDADVAWEAADVLYFTFVALASRGVGMQRVIDELKRRRKEKCKGQDLNLRTR